MMQVSGVTKRDMMMRVCERQIQTNSHTSSDREKIGALQKIALTAPFLSGLRKYCTTIHQKLSIFIILILSSNLFRLYAECFTDLGKLNFPMVVRF